MPLLQYSIGGDNYLHFRHAWCADQLMTNDKKEKSDVQRGRLTEAPET